MTVFEYFGKCRDEVTKIHWLLSGLPAAQIPARVLKAWEVGGLLTPAYTANGEVAAWTNVIVHQVTAARLAFNLASALRQRFQLTLTETEEIIEAVLVHDFHKRLETGKIRAAQKIGGSVSEASVETELRSTQLLSGLGFSRNVISLVAATGTNGVELMLFGQPSLGEKLVFYCGDCCVSGDQIMPYKKRFEAARIQYQPSGRYAGQDEEFGQKYGQGVIDTYFLILEPLQQQLAELLGFKDDPGKIPQHYS